LIIRKEQMQVFEEARLPDFEDYMVEHLKDFSPLHSESLGDVPMRTLVRSGMKRAKKHGFTHRGPVRFYIETMILLGADFDTDPQYPWACERLRDSAVLNQTQRADRLYNTLMDFLESVAGPDREYATRALHKAKEIPFEPTPVSSPDFGEVMIRRMQEVHPEKVDYVGQAAMRELVSRAIEEARRFSVSTDAGVCLFLGLMFMLGHGFVHDPMYPWLANTLSNPAVEHPQKRVERLYSKAMTYLDRVLLHIDGN
jgi:hypothetical protein